MEICILVSEHLVKIYLLQQFLSRWILFTGPDWWRSCLEEIKLYGVYHHYRSLGTICNHFMIKINRSGVTQYKNLCSCRWSPTFNFLDYLSIHPSIPLHLKYKVNLESYSKITFKVISKRYASDWGWQSSHSLVLHLCDHNLLYSLCFAPYFSEKSIFLTVCVSVQFIKMKTLYLLCHFSWFLTVYPIIALYH